MSLQLQPNPHIAAMAPYPLAKIGSAEARPQVSLAQNESMLPASPLAIEAARQTLGNAQLYPDPDWTDLRQAISEVHALPPDAILCGCGSMELIAAIAGAYLGPGRAALTTAYGYLFFQTAARRANARIDLAPERDFTVDVERVAEALRPDTQVVFLANPGNPTGTLIGRDAIHRLRRALPEPVLLVVDEAYGEFAEGAAATCFDLVAGGNCVVLRTFSKVYGLAGMRVGWGLFPREIAREVRKVLNPNNITAAAQAAATAAMRDQAYMRRVRDETAERRDRTAAALRGLGIAVPRSRTNFLLLRFPSEAAALSADKFLRADGLVLRRMEGYGLGDCLRATIADEASMTSLHDSLRTWAEQPTTS